MDIRRARLILNALPNIGPVTLRRLMDDFGGSPETILNTPRARLMGVRGVGPAIADTVVGWKTHFDPEREERRIAERGMDFVIPEDEGYPPLLKEIFDPPIGLYASGSYRPGRRCVSIVGTRRPTPYGKSLAREISKNLASAGWCLVSGLARGVDTEVHRGALDVGGKTVAVLGCGADIVYPPENLELYREISAKGAVISEFPLGRPADKRTFPMRNRIVAGMCKAVVVVESDEDGGSLITARFAADMGRSVCAFPGRVDQPTSRGCHALIREGATLVTSVEEILEELGEVSKQREMDFGASEKPPEDSAASPTESRLLALFAGGDRLSPDALCERSGLPVGEVNATLLMLELSGRVVRTQDGIYESR
jgi:DNA processing protein